MATREQLMQALIAADQAGSTEDAIRIAQMIKDKDSSYSQWPPSGEETQRLYKAPVRQDIVDSASQGPSVDERFVKTAGGLTAQLVTGAIAEPVAGALGAGEAILTLDPERGAERVEKVRSAMIPDPSPETSQALQAVAEYIPEIGPRLGRFTYEQTGSPAASTFAETLPTLAAEIVGLGVLRKLPRGTQLKDVNGNPTKDLRKVLDDQGLVYESLSPEAKAAIPAVADETGFLKLPKPGTAAEQALVEQIKSGGTDSSLAGLTVSGNRVIKDRLGAEALKQGWAPGFVQLMKTATPQTRALADQMITLHKRVRGDDSLASKGVRPSNIVGDSVSKRLQFLKDQTNTARLELDRIAKNDLEGMSINPQSVVGNFYQHMQDLGVHLYDKDGLPVSVYDNVKPAKIDFSDSIIIKNKNAQKAAKDVIELLTTKGPIDAQRAHKIKRQLDDLIDFKKKSKGGLSEEGRRIMKSVRHDINQSIREVHEGYAQTNDILSESLTALDDFQTAAGPSIEIFGRGADSAIGTKMRILLSNYQNRIKLDNALNQVEDTARKYGADFKDDPRHLVMVANALDARGGAIAQGSLTSEVEKAFNRVLNQGMYQELMGQGANIASKTYRKATGVNEFNAYESLYDLVRNQ